MKPILEVRGISKKFKIQHERQAYLSLRDSLGNLFTKNKSEEEFWALKDVSFDLYPGDSVGIIGRNGAGKSTLLKILSKITPPTNGSIISRGRIASLLEVGTGFHPELSGRENIYLNGSILGLKKTEINKHFDAIVEFSGVEKFLDTPLKHYSSGMQLRLAFAVAAHLEPEILIIDEVLAVGDAEFQKKCIGKMDEVSKSGRTILFVSHNIDIINTICNRGILLSSGTKVQDASMLEVTKNYLHNYLNNKQETNNFNFGKSLSLQEIKIGGDLITTNSEVDIRIEFIVHNDIEIRSLGLLFYNSNEVRVGIVNLKLIGRKYIFSGGSKLVLEGRITDFPLIEGLYDVGLFLETEEVSGNFLGLKTIKVINREDSLVHIYNNDVRGFVEFNCVFNLKS